MGQQLLRRASSTTTASRHSTGCEIEVVGYYLVQLGEKRRVLNTDRPVGQTGRTDGKLLYKRVYLNQITQEA